MSSNPSSQGSEAEWVSPSEEFPTPASYEMNYSFTIPFERNFDVMPTTKFFQNYWLISSLVISAVYLTMIRVGERVMAWRGGAKLELRPMLFLWNASFAVFSLVGAFRMLPELFYVLRNFGFVNSVCDPSFATHEVTGCWTELFAWSKLIELGDTVFLVLRRRPVIFLHWYHHVTVLAYTWHACKDHTAAGRWFVGMNYTIHAMMYAYYAIRTLGCNRLPKFIPFTITTLQLSQMIVGCYIGYTVYHVKTGGAQPCNQTFQNLGLCSFMYFTYALLFAHYFYAAYIQKPSTPASSNPGAHSERSRGAANGDANGDAPRKNLHQNGNYSNHKSVKNGKID